MLQEEIEAHKKEWELAHLKSLKEEEEKAAAASDSDPEDILTIPREESCQVNNRSLKVRSSKAQNAIRSGSISSKTTITTRRSRIKKGDDSSKNDSSLISSKTSDRKSSDTSHGDSSINSNSQKRRPGRPCRRPTVRTTPRSSPAAKKRDFVPIDQTPRRTRQSSIGMTTRHSNNNLINSSGSTGSSPSVRNYFTRRSHERL